MQEDRKADAIEARDRALQAIVGVEDFATQRELWILAKTYNDRHKASDARGGDFARASLAW